MLNLGRTASLKSATIALSLVLSLSMVLASGAPGTATTTATTSKTTVAHNPEGKAASRIVGTTADGRRVTGDFIPLRFLKKDGRVKVRGLVNGVVHNADGSTRTFGVMRTLRVRSINGTRPISVRRAVQAQAACDVLHLVLGPLDLDLLGLKVHLDKVVLDVVAQPGPGNLLGNLLCAVAGLLDGGLQGVLGRLVDVLNQILGRLGLGL